MRTKYSKSNAEFSNLAHTCAKLLIYPQIFKTIDLKFESTLVGDDKRNSVLDGELAIDRIVHVVSKDNKLKGPLKFTVQERFRKINYVHYKDLTITEWNYNSDLPSELYKIASGMFLYGYFDPVNLFFREVILINTIDLLFQMSQGLLDYKIKRNPKNQTFLVIPFDLLEERPVGATRKAPVLLVDDAESQELRGLELHRVVGLLRTLVARCQLSRHPDHLEAAVLEVVGLLGVEGQDAKRQPLVR